MLCFVSEYGFGKYNTMYVNKAEVSFNDEFYLLGGTVIGRVYLLSFICPCDGGDSFFEKYFCKNTTRIGKWTGSENVSFRLNLFYK